MDLLIRPTTEAEKATLEPFDNTKLTAINTCPTWGIITYGHHKAWPNKGRGSAATNAGGAAHEVFAANRIWRLHHNQKLTEHAMRTGERTFGVDRWRGMQPLLHHPNPERNDYLSFCLEALYTSGLVDDPSEKRKGMASVEEACLVYLDRIDMAPSIYVSDRNNPSCFVGIEQPFDLVVEYEGFSFRFTGKIDGIEVHDRQVPWVHENKTASRLNEAWLASFQTSHQVTGYRVAASFQAQVDIENIRIHGLSVPLPKSYDFGGMVNEDVVRKSHHVVAWLRWVRHTVDIYNTYKANPNEAPLYTHSCNRYFRPCSLIPFCAGNLEDKKEIWDFLVDDEWSPLADGA